MNTNARGPKIGDIVTVDDEQVPEEWARTGEVIETNGQSYVIELEDGHRCEVLPDQLQVVETNEPPAVELVNCTPHPITVVGMTIAPSGIIPRVAEEITQVGAVSVQGVEVPLTEVRLGQVQGLPDVRPGTLYVVSRMTAEAAPHRTDLLIPGKQVRDGQGRIIGCETLSRLPRTV